MLEKTATYTSNKHKGERKVHSIPSTEPAYRALSSLRTNPPSIIRCAHICANIRTASLWRRTISCFRERVKPFTPPLAPSPVVFQPIAPQLCHHYVLSPRPGARR